MRSIHLSGARVFSWPGRRATLL